MKRVLFLGAGASKELGLLLTREILARIVRRLQPKSEPRLFRGEGSRENAELADEEFLRVGIGALYPGLDLNALIPNTPLNPSAPVDPLAQTLPDITQVLSFIDHLIARDQPALPGFGPPELTRLRLLFDRAICEVLSVSFLSNQISSDIPGINDLERQRMTTLLYELGRTPGQRNHVEDHGKSDVLARFKLYVEGLRGPGDELAIITTNYDVALDQAIYSKILHDYQPGLSGRTFERAVAGAVDTGFEYRLIIDGGIALRPVKPDYCLFKLHGSLNWLRCDVCEQIYVNPVADIAYLGFHPRQEEENTCHCGHFPLRPVIVAPSSVRDVRSTHLLSVWKAAAEALRTADEWIMVGYSLPAEDLAIRSMLFRTYHARGRQRLANRAIDKWPFRDGPVLNVVQHGESARAAYTLLFPKCAYFSGGLLAWLDKQRIPSPPLTDTTAAGH